VKKIYEPLTDKEWGEHYNIKQLKQVINGIENNKVQVWAEELCNIIPEGAKCIEIGCGTGMSSLWLAKNGRIVTALDYTDESIELVKVASEYLKLSVETIKCDATQQLPFEKNYFDYLFQCGLLEHFNTDKQIELLRNWGRVSKNVVSMIPNATSVAYRVGKEIMEKNDTWEYGLEIPKHTMVHEFIVAGLKDIREYTIGTEWAMKFLPENHYVKQMIMKLIKEGFDLDAYGQGYLLVTIGKSKDIC